MIELIVLGTVLSKFMKLMAMWIEILGLNENKGIDNGT